jgi:hypothetical protein
MTATGFTAVRSHRVAVAGAADRAQASDNCAIAIKMSATDGLPVRLHIIAVIVVLRIRENGLTMPLVGCGSRETTIEHSISCSTDY